MQPWTEASAVRKEINKMTFRSYSANLALQCTQSSSASTYGNIYKSIHSKKTKRRRESGMKKIMTKMNHKGFSYPPIRSM